MTGLSALDAPPLLRRRAALLFGAGAALGGAWPARSAADWPLRPVRILVAGPPGGVADIIARLLVEAVGPALGQPLVVEYKPGASGAIAVHELLSAPADGHTFLMIQRGIATELPLAVKVRYDPFTDLQPLAQLAQLGLVLVGSPHLPARDLPELVALARARPGELHFAGVGFGLLSHTLGLRFAQRAGVDIPFVGYQGAPTALQDLLGGHVPLMVEAPPVLVHLIRSGQVRAYATSTAIRAGSMPDVPTFAECGYPELSETSWFALWARPEVPPAARDRMRAAALGVVQSPRVRIRLAELGMDPGLPWTGDDLARDLREAYARQAKVLQALGFSLR